MKRKILYLFFPLMVGIILGISLSIKFDILPNLRSQSFKTEDISYYSISSLEEAVINVANTVGKAVVSISTEYTKEFPTKKFYFGYPFEGTPFEDDFFRRFFDEFFGELPPRHYKQVALGSGVIINSEGYI
ncbi:MAG: hypothetical protein NC900_02880, partial [Candidatus Omnitrophica bacterium]|nr:hypothetical protein [Candidatus Omnitrophota bacterium]